MWKALDHTADALLLIEADGWPELCAEAARAFGGWLAGEEFSAPPRDGVSRVLRAEGDDRVETWVAWWRSLHRSWVVEGLLPIDARVDASASEREVSGSATCAPAASLLLDQVADVKAVTWHRARVDHLATGGWRGTIVLDI